MMKELIEDKQFDKNLNRLFSCFQTMNIWKNKDKKLEKLDRKCQESQEDQGMVEDMEVMELEMEVMENMKVIIVKTIIKNQRVTQTMVEIMNIQEG